MTVKLTLKQDKAVMKYVECGDKSEAYRHAYNTENMKPETIWRSANELFDNPKVTARVEELQAEHRTRHNVTVDTLTDELDAAKDLAMLRPEGASAAVSAILGKAKLHGLLIEKRLLETIPHTSDASKLSDDELAEIIVRAKQIREKEEGSRVKEEESEHIH